MGERGKELVKREQSREWRKEVKSYSSQERTGYENGGKLLKEIVKRIVNGETFSQEIVKKEQGRE